jgi:hypothetical protein
VLGKSLRGGREVGPWVEGAGASQKVPDGQGEQEDLSQPWKDRQDLSTRRGEESMKYQEPQSFCKRDHSLSG